MSPKPIRVQLPGGSIYAPALREAASKTAARSGVSKRRAKAFQDLAIASVEVLNGADATVITLEMIVHEDELSATLVGEGCSVPSKRALSSLDKLADKKSRAFERTRSRKTLTISFEV